MVPAARPSLARLGTSDKRWAPGPPAHSWPFAVRLLMAWFAPGQVPPGSRGEVEHPTDLVGPGERLEVALFDVCWRAPRAQLEALAADLPGQHVREDTAEHAAAPEERGLQLGAEGQVLDDLRKRRRSSRSSADTSPAVYAGWAKRGSIAGPSAPPCGPLSGLCGAARRSLHGCPTAA